MGPIRLRSFESSVYGASRIGDGFPYGFRRFWIRCALHYSWRNANDKLHKRHDELCRNKSGAGSRYIRSYKPSRILELLRIVYSCGSEGEFHHHVVSVGLASLEAPSWSGGIASHLGGLQNALRHRGIHVESVRGFGVAALARFHPFQFIPTYLMALKRLRNTDILHAHDARLVTLGKRLGIPIITTFHGYLPEETQMRGARHALIELCKDFVYACVQDSDALIAVDNRIAHWLWENYGANNIHVIQNGVDSEMFHPEIASMEEIGLLQGSGSVSVAREVWRNNENPMILFAKGLSPKNGASVLVEAMPIVRKSFPGADLFMATGQVPHEQMPSLIRQAEIVVIPSVPVAGVEEATSILALEAMASEKCVIASNIGGLREIIENDRTGILVPPGDPEILAEEIVAALQDDERRRQLGRAAREAVVRDHSWAKVAEQTMKVYEEVFA